MVVFLRYKPLKTILFFDDNHHMSNLRNKVNCQQKFQILRIFERSSLMPFLFPKKSRLNRNRCPSTEKINTVSYESILSVHSYMIIKVITLVSRVFVLVQLPKLICFSRKISHLLSFILPLVDCSRLIGNVFEVTFVLIIFLYLFDIINLQIHTWISKSKILK